MHLRDKTSSGYLENYVTLDSGKGTRNRSITYNYMPISSFKYVKEPSETNRFLRNSENKNLFSWNETTNTDSCDASVTCESLSANNCRKRPNKSGLYGGKQRFQIPLSHSEIPSIFSQKPNYVRMNAILGAARDSTNGETPLVNRSGDTGVKQIPVKLPRTRSLLSRQCPFTEPDSNLDIKVFLQKPKYKKEIGSSKILPTYEGITEIKTSPGVPRDLLVEENIKNHLSTPSSNADKLDKAQNMLNNYNSNEAIQTSFLISHCVIESEIESNEGQSKRTAPSTIYRTYANQLVSRLKHRFKSHAFCAKFNSTINSKGGVKMHGEMEVNGSIYGDHTSTPIIIGSKNTSGLQLPRQFYCNNNASKPKPSKGLETIKHMLRLCFGLDLDKQKQYAKEEKLEEIEDGSRSFQIPIPLPRYNNTNQIQTLYHEVDVTLEDMVNITTLKSLLNTLDFVDDYRDMSPIFDMSTTLWHTHDAEKEAIICLRSSAEKAGGDADYFQVSDNNTPHLLLITSLSDTCFQNLNMYTGPTGMQLVECPLMLKDEDSVDLSKAFTSSDHYLIPVPFPSEESGVTSSIPEEQMQQVHEMNSKEAQRSVVAGSGLWHILPSTRSKPRSFNSEIVPNSLVKDNDNELKEIVDKRPTIKLPKSLTKNDNSNVMKKPKSSTLSSTLISDSEFECLAAFMKNARDDQFSRSSLTISCRIDYPNENCRPNYRFECQERNDKLSIPQIRGRTNLCTYTHLESQSNECFGSQPFVPFCFFRLAELKASRLMAKPFKDIISFNGSNQNYCCESALWMPPNAMNNQWIVPQKLHCSCLSANKMDINKRFSYKNTTTDSSSESSNFYCSSPSELSSTYEVAEILDLGHYNDKDNHNKCSQRPNRSDCEYCSTCCKRILSGTYAMHANLPIPQRIQFKKEPQSDMPMTLIACCGQNRDQKQSMSKTILDANSSKPRSCLATDADEARDKQPCIIFNHLDKCCEKKCTQVIGIKPRNYRTGVNAPKSKENSCTTFTLFDCTPSMASKAVDASKQPKRTAIKSNTQSSRVDKLSWTNRESMKRGYANKSTEIVYWDTAPSHKVSQKSDQLSYESKGRNATAKILCCTQQLTKPKWCGPFDKPECNTLGSRNSQRFHSKQVYKKDPRKVGKGTAGPLRNRMPLPSGEGWSRSHIRKPVQFISSSTFNKKQLHPHLSSSSPPPSLSFPSPSAPSYSLPGPMNGSMPTKHFGAFHKESDASMQCSCSQLSPSNSLCTCSVPISSYHVVSAGIQSDSRNKTGNLKNLRCCCVEVTTQTDLLPRFESPEPQFTPSDRYQKCPPIDSSKRYYKSIYPCRGIPKERYGCLC